MPVLIGIGLLVGAFLVLATFLAASVWINNSEVASVVLLAIFLLSGATIAGYGVTNGHPPAWLLVPFIVSVVLMMGAVMAGDEW